MIEAENLQIGYKASVMAEAPSLRLEKGLTGLIGRNGAGKSTLIKTLTGAIPALGGEVRLNGKPLRCYSRKELSKLISIVTTESGFSGGLRLHELVAIGRSPHTGLFGKLTPGDEEAVANAMRQTGIYHKKDAFVAELSDGERQKGMIARALVQDTPIVIMDEPFAFLDVGARLEMQSLIYRIAAAQNKAVLYSTHEVSEALRVADRIWLVSGGKILEGTPPELISQGEADRLFIDSGVEFDRENLNYKLIKDFKDE